MSSASAALPQAPAGPSVITSLLTRKVMRYCASCSTPVLVPGYSDDAWHDTARCETCKRA